MASQSSKMTAPTGPDHVDCCPNWNVVTAGLGNTCPNTLGESEQSLRTHYGVSSSEIPLPPALPIEVRERIVDFVWQLYGVALADGSSVPPPAPPSKTQPAAAPGRPRRQVRDPDNRRGAAAAAAHSHRASAHPRALLPSPRFAASSARPRAQLRHNQSTTSAHSWDAAAASGSGVSVCCCVCAGPGDARLRTAVPRHVDAWLKAFKTSRHHLGFCEPEDQVGSERGAGTLAIQSRPYQ
ncbi:hypothetical protein AcW1_005591 [Taiwanofungus camphoratus]|nr:hypothetical protein AcV5_005917 [Antrodia cinnamomea]KAI0957091.1 hypothetical protein AcW1_005591 [Antrodia cinnamomea]